MAKFTMQTLNTVAKTGEKKYFPHLLCTGTTTLDELAERIEAQSSFTSADVKGVVDALTREIAAAAAQGRTVAIDGLGSFRATLALTPEAEKELADGKTRRNATSVRVGGFNFRPAQRFVGAANNAAHLERIMPRNDGKQAAETTLEERLELARHYLTTHRWMGVKDYAMLCGLKHTTASVELRAAAAAPDSFLATEGSASHKVYVLK